MILILDSRDLPYEALTAEAGFNRVFFINQPPAGETTLYAQEEMKTLICRTPRVFLENSPEGNSNATRIQAYVALHLPLPESLNLAGPAAVVA